MAASGPAVLRGAQALIRVRDSGTGVLILHGFTGNPGEMRYLGEKLYEAGYSVSIPRYPGHGTSLHEMIRTSSKDWYRAAREAYLELASRCSKVYIAGLSMGGLFTIRLACEFDPEKIVLISTPRTIRNPMIFLAPFVGIFKRILWQKDRVKGINWPEARERHVCYDQGIPVRQAWDVYRLMGRTMRLLPGVRSKALIVHSTGDETIAPDSGEYISRRIGSAQKETVVFTRSNHTIPVDYDRDELAERVIGFFAG